MFRYVVLSFSVFLFSTSVLGQPLTDSSGNEAPTRENAPPSVKGPGREFARTETRVSIARLKVPPKVRELYEKAARALLKRKHKEAQQKLDEALRMYPLFPEALTLSGALHLNENQWTTAEKNLQQAIEIDPDYGPAYAVLAGLYNSEARFDDGLRMAERAEALDSHSWDIQYELARALIGKHKYRRALQISNAALLRQHGTLMHLTKAHALTGLGNYSQAEAELRAYLRFNPAGDGAADAHNLLNKIERRLPTKGSGAGE